MLRVFIGYDSREPAAFHVLAHSILRHCSEPVSIAPLVQSVLREQSLYWRPRDLHEATEFSMTRFLVPFLCDYKGTAIFMDCDMLAKRDLGGVFREHVDQVYPWTVAVCPHDYTPKSAMKMDGQQQTTYPRKNWSSFMVFNNERCRALSPTYVNEAPGLELHRFHWAPENEILRLPLEWNWLVGEYQKNAAARVLHYTLGGPWFPEYANCDHAAEWIAEKGAAGI